jgi:hypothetical protein
MQNILHGLIVNIIVYHHFLRSKDELIIPENVFMGPIEIELNLRLVPQIINVS